MKIRIGFISNSSSASYFVEIKIPPQKFFTDIMQNYSWEIFNKKYIIDKLQKRIAEITESISMSSHHTMYYDTQLRIETGLLRNLRRARSYRDIVYNICDYYYIKLSETDNSVTLRGGTVMHNTYDDMPEVIKEILLYFLMDTKFPVKAWTEHDQ